MQTAPVKLQLPWADPGFSIGVGTLVRAATGSGEMASWPGASILNVQPIRGAPKLTYSGMGVTFHGASGVDREGRGHFPPGSAHGSNALVSGMVRG